MLGANESIPVLTGADRVRLRPAIIFGSNHLEGAFFTFKELLCNALDEANKGYGDLIEVTYHKDHSISIRDYGRGVPMGYNETLNKYAWEVIFNGLLSHDVPSATHEGVKLIASGFNLGVACSQYTSSFFNVTSFRGNKAYKKSFTKGNPTDMDLIIEDKPNNTTGTLIHYKPDDEVFIDTLFPFDMIKQYCEYQSYIRTTPITILDEVTSELLKYPGTSIASFLETKLNNRSIILTTKKVTQGYVNDKEYKADCEVALAYSETCDTTKQFYFHNTKELSSYTGVHVKAFTDALNKFSELKGTDISNHISIIISSTSTHTHYTNSLKDGIANTFMYTLLFDTITELLNRLL